MVVAVVAMVGLVTISMHSGKFSASTDENLAGQAYRPRGIIQPPARGNAGIVGPDWSASQAGRGVATIGSSTKGRIIGPPDSQRDRR